jgi:hypothetical protein
VISEDFNGDGDPDLAAANDGSDSVSILLGDGAGSFAAKTDFPTGSLPRSVTSDDFNGDGKPDLAVADLSSSTVSVLLGDGAGSFAPKTDFPTGTFPSSVTSDDFDRDGERDLALANFSSSTISVLPGNGTGSFAPRTDFPTGMTPLSVISDDFDRDGRPDLASANGSSNTVSVLLGDGAGSFAPRTDFPTGTGPYTVTGDDFNGDGVPDLAVTNLNSASVSVLLGDGTGSFGAKTDFATGLLPRSVTSDDFNGDGKPDLAVTNVDSDTVSVLLGDGSPDPVVTPARLEFQSQSPATLGPARTVTVTNSGPGYPLTVSRVSTAGSDRDDFIITSDDCSGGSVGSAGSCEIRLRFAPSAVGARDARLEISHNGLESPLAIPLSGVGTDPRRGGGRPKIKRPGRTPRRVGRNRAIDIARVKCVEGPCRIRRVKVRFNIRNRIFNGVGRFGSQKIAAGGSRVIRTTMKRRLYRKLKRGRLSGTVTAVVTATSGSGARNRQGIRTGLRR